MSLQKKSSVLAAMKQTLEAAKFKGDAWSATPFADQAMFQRVDVIDVEHLEEGFTNLLNFKDRIALVVSLGATWDSEFTGSEFSGERDLLVKLVICDRDWAGLGTAAFFGDGQKYPGLYEMAEDLVELFSGNVVAGNNAIVSQVTGEQSISLVEESKGKITKSRKGYEIEFRITCGTLKLSLKRGRGVRS